jgi:hypothetical protein
MLVRGRRDNLRRASEKQCARPRGGRERGLRTYSAGLRHDILHHVTGDSGQPDVQPLKLFRESLVIDSHQREHRCVQVMDIDDVFHRAVAKFIRRAIGDAALYAAAGEKNAEAENVVIAPGALTHRRSAKLAAPEDQRVVEHPALLEIFD